MEKKNKKSIIIGMTVLLLIALTILGLAYAYYRTRILGNLNDETLDLITKVLKVKYSDNNAVVGGTDIQPGDSFVKTFTVENTGDGVANYSIIFDNVLNEYMRKDDWTYKLYEGSEEKEDKLLKSGIIPSSTTYVINSISIDKNVTNTYTLRVAYVNSAEDQSIDMGTSLQLRINIAESVGEIFATAKEGTLLAAIGNDNIISDPVTKPGKAASGLKYAESIGELESSDISSSNQGRYYFAYSDTYEFDEESGTYKLINPTIDLYSKIYQNLAGKYIGTNISSEKEYLQTSNFPTIRKVITATANTTSTYTYNTLSSNITEVSESTLSPSKDDYATSYYFRGNVDNNYLNYSGMCWRIVRVLGNGTIKIVLADSNGECNASTYSLENTKSAFIDMNKYDYYRTDSAIIEDWSTTENLNTAKLVDANWCYDTSISSTREWGLVPSSGGAYTSSYDGTGYFELYYGAYGRLYNRSTAKPSLKCDFTGLNNSTSKAPSGLIGSLTADEIAFAGGIQYLHYTNENGYIYYYLMDNATYHNDNYSASYRTGSPHHYDGEIDTYTYVVDTNGKLSADNIGDMVHIRPAVVLSKDAEVTTDTNSSFASGTQKNPYVVSE